MGFEGLKLLAEAGKDYDLPIITEVLSPTDVESVARYADILQIGARNPLDLGSIQLIKRMRHLPILVDPSHAAGRRDWVTPLALAAQAVGSHGIIVEIHPQPERALNDGPQALRYPGFADLMHKIYVPGVRQDLS